MKAGADKAALAASPRQLAAVIDLGKCMGCQTCVMACKSLWTQRPGTEHMRWMSVATCPGRGYPRDFESKGGGFDTEGRPRQGELTTLVECGDAFQFNHEEVLFEGERAAEEARAAQRPRRPARVGLQLGRRPGHGRVARTPTSSTCRAFATTARSRPASTPVPGTRSTSARTASW